MCKDEEKAQKAFKAQGLRQRAFESRGTDLEGYEAQALHVSKLLCHVKLTTKGLHINLHKRNPHRRAWYKRAAKADNALSGHPLAAHRNRAMATEVKAQHQ